MKKYMKVIITTALVTSGTAAYAASHSYSNNGPNQGQEGGTTGTFWTVYARNANSQSITVSDASRRDVSMDWDLKDQDGADYVAGGGWQNVSSPTNVSYKLFAWSTPRGKGTFGVYGWSCGVPAGNLNVEYYVVDAWFGGWTPPSSGKYKLNKKTGNRPIQTNNGTYDIYDSNQIDNEPSYCSGNKPFKQVWAVRTVNRYVRASTTNPGNATINFSVLKNKMDDYGYFNAKSAYLVVGAEGGRNSKGHIRIQVNKN